MPKFMAVYFYNKQETFGTNWGFGNTTALFDGPLTEAVIRDLEGMIKEQNNLTNCVVLNLIPIQK